MRTRSWQVRLLLLLLLPSWRMALLGIGLSNLSLLALSSWFITAMAVAGATGATLDYTTPAAAVRALALARAGGRYAERYVNHDTTLRILSTIRVWFFRRLEPLAPARLQEHRSGDLLGRIRSDVDTLDDFYVRGVVPSVAAVLAVLVLVPILARFDARLAVIDLAGLALGGLLFPLLLQKIARKPGRERVALASELRASVVEQAQGMAELIALGAVREQERRTSRLVEELDRRERRLALLQGIGEAGLLAASSLAVWAAALLLVPPTAAGLVPGPVMAMLVMLVLASFESVMPLPAVLQRAGELAAAARRLFHLIDAAPAVTGPERPAPPPASEPAQPLALSISGLRFRYSTDSAWIFDGLSFDVPAGGRLGISGPSGAGKSTLVSLLLRFWDYGAGSIAIGSPGVELRSLSTDDAIRQFSIVPQSPFLFHASIRENLELALPEGKATDLEAMRDALDAAQLSALVGSLPAGLETEVGERGREMSAGEVRRLAVARALLKEAPIYVLDEPTEGLDDRTADQLLAALDARLRGRTLVVISHRERDFGIVDRVVRLRRSAFKRVPPERARPRPGTVSGHT